MVCEKVIKTNHRVDCVVLKLVMTLVLLATIMMKLKIMILNRHVVHIHETMNVVLFKKLHWLHPLVDAILHESENQQIFIKLVFHK